MIFLVIVLLSGTEAHLNPREIVTILQARDADDPSKRYTEEVRCVIQMSNGEQFTTKEECASIEARLRTIFEERLKRARGQH